MQRAKRFIPVAFLFLVCPGRAQERVTETWFATFDGPAGSHDRANAIAIDPHGNVHVTGRSQTGLQYERPFAGGPEGDIVRCPGSLSLSPGRFIPPRPGWYDGP